MKEHVLLCPFIPLFRKAEKVWFRKEKKNINYTVDGERDIKEKKYENVEILEAV